MFAGLYIPLITIDLRLQRPDHLRISSVVAAFYNDSGLNLYSVSLVLLLNIQKYLRERAKSHTSIHGVIKNVKLHWNLGIFNFIVRLTL